MTTESDQTGEPVSDPIKNAALKVCESFHDATYWMTIEDKKLAHGLVQALVGFELATGEIDDSVEPDAGTLTPEQKMVVYTMGILHELHTQRILSRGDDSEGLTPTGFALFDQLKASGYKPAEDEMRACLIAWLRGDDIS